MPKLYENIAFSTENKMYVNHLVFWFVADFMAVCGNAWH